MKNLFRFVGTVAVAAAVMECVIRGMDTGLAILGRKIKEAKGVRACNR